MIRKVYFYGCDDCKLVREYPDKSTPKNLGWAVAHDGKTCYCPTCALRHRSTGCKGVKSNGSGQQIKIV